MEKISVKRRRKLGRYKKRNECGENERKIETVGIYFPKKTDNLNLANVTKKNVNEG